MDHMYVFWQACGKMQAAANVGRCHNLGMITGDSVNTCFADLSGESCMIQHKTAGCTATTGVCRQLFDRKVRDMA